MKLDDAAEIMVVSKMLINQNRPFDKNEDFPLYELATHFLRYSVCASALDDNGCFEDVKDAHVEYKKWLSESREAITFESSLAKFYTSFSSFLIEGCLNSALLNEYSNYLATEMLSVEWNNQNENLFEKWILTNAILGHTEKCNAILTLIWPPKKGSVIECLADAIKHVDSGKAETEKATRKYYEALNKERKRLINPMIEGFCYFYYLWHLMPERICRQDIARFSFEDQAPPVELF